MNLYYHKRVGLDMIYYWKQIVKFIPAFLIIIASELVVTTFFSMDGLFAFVIHGVVYLLIFVVSMWLLGMNQAEKELILGPLRKIKKLYLN